MFILFYFILFHAGRNVDYRGKYPWLGSLQQYGTHQCGVSLLSEHWSITAAHCVGVPMYVPSLKAIVKIRAGRNTAWLFPISIILLDWDSKFRPCLRSMMVIYEFIYSIVLNTLRPSDAYMHQ